MFLLNISQSHTARAFLSQLYEAQAEGQSKRIFYDVKWPLVALYTHLPDGS